MTSRIFTNVLLHMHENGNKFTFRQTLTQNSKFMRAASNWTTNFVGTFPYLQRKTACVMQIMECWAVEVG